MTQPNQSASLAVELESELAHFTGTESYTNLRYPWLHKRFLLTDGAHHLAEKAKAFWLMDAIASHQINKQLAAEEFQFWKLTVNEKHEAVLICTDGNDKQLVRQEIRYTDLCADSRN